MIIERSLKHFGYTSYVLVEGISYRSVVSLNQIVLRVCLVARVPEVESNREGQTLCIQASD